MCINKCNGMIVSSYLKELEHSVKEVSAYRKYKKRFKNKDSSSIKSLYL